MAEAIDSTAVAPETDSTKKKDASETAKTKSMVVETNDERNELMSPSTDTTMTLESKVEEDQPIQTEILVVGLEAYEKMEKPKDEDDRSVVSSSSSTSSVLSRYFEPADFLPWEELYAKAEYAPHVGFAMVAGSFAFIHPFMFFAGVVTAMGALKAAGATYDYATCQIQPGPNQRVTGTDGNDSNSITSTSFCEWLPTAFTLNDSEMTTGDETGETTQTPSGIKEGDEDSIPNLAEATSACSTTASTIADSAEDEANAKTKTKVNDSVIDVPAVPTVIQSPSHIQQQSTFETHDPVEWVKDSFPSLTTISLDKVAFRGLHPQEFFDVFFADDAPFGFHAFHKLRRDIEVNYGSWKNGISSEVFHADYNGMEVPSSMVTKERNIEYHAKTNSFLGPAYAPTNKIQRAYFVSKKMLVVDIKTTLHDFPFSRHFYLIERWIVDGTRSSGYTKSPSKDRKKQKYHSAYKDSSSRCLYVTVSSRVYFTQECAFESTITKESAKQMCEISKCWKTMAQDGLKRTEEARMKRLRQKELEEQQQQVLGEEQQGLSTGRSNKFENEEGIEIEHIDSPSSAGKNKGLKNGRRRGKILLRRSPSSQLSNSDQTQQNRPLRNRTLSRTFTKLLSRSSSGNSIDESPEKGLSSTYPKVRISSAGVPSV